MRHNVKRKIISFREFSIIEESFLYILGKAAKEKADNPGIEIYLSFEGSMTKSKSFFKKLCKYSYENNLGIMVDQKTFLPDGGESSLDKNSFDLLMKENFNSQ